MKITPAAGKTFADIMKGVNRAKIPEDSPKIDRFLKTRGPEGGSERHRRIEKPTGYNHS